ncbi:MAG: nicotinamide-nucleotide amidohydrolase family protein [Burkholderiales bacterium]|nr:nicotinamide-nucleotide amidohydrolase family protein [Burkholderiales bacterium]
MRDEDLIALAARLGQGLKSGGHMLVTAESCTGGWIAQAVTAIAGCSDWFERGYVSYSNASKQEALGVSAQTLTRFGAVSEETAREMALGALAASRASAAVAVTGVAGPSGGSVEKPVGMVCFAWALRDRPPRSETCRFAGDRREVRRRSVVRALQGLIDVLDAAQSGD